MPKYKKGDVLQTTMGTIFTIKGVRSKQEYPALSLGKTYTGVYLLDGHFHHVMPIYHIDNAEHIFPATKAARILYGK